MVLPTIPDFNQLIEALWRPPGLGRRLLRQLASQLRSPSELFVKSDAAIEKRWGRWPDPTLQVLQKLRRQSVGFAEDFLSFRDPRFPSKLERLADAPCGFYFRGDLQWLQHAGPWIGVVGTRHASTEALRFCETLVDGLKSCRPMIVSGLAEGIDGAAHRAALHYGLPTLGVLGTSIDRIYPFRNRPLAREMIEHGLILSEFPPQTKTSAWHFPQRNRLIAALSDLLIIVEAPEKSGALITADFALDLGIDIYAVPGLATSVQNRGGHRLIQQGARLLMDAEEILVDLGFQKKASTKASARPSKLKREAPVELAGLSDQEVKLLKLMGFHPAQIDKIPGMSHLATAELVSLLQGLVLEGWLEEWPGKYFSLNPARRELLSKA